MPKLKTNRSARKRIRITKTGKAKHFKAGELEKLCSLDFHFKEVNNRFKKLGL